MEASDNILFTRQTHDAKRAGKHFDIRLVHGDKAYSFATKKELPEVGKSIMLYEQPVHDASYALSKRVEIPEGQYGAGTTVLDFVRKAKLEERSKDHFILSTKQGEKYLLKKVPMYGQDTWLFRNLGVSNKYLEKIATTIHLYENKKTKKQKWFTEKNPPKNSWVKIGPSKHIKKKINVPKS